MSLPTLAAAAAVLLAVVGAAAPHNDGDRPVRALAHHKKKRPHLIAPAERVHFAAAPADGLHRQQRSGRRASPAFADFPKMKG